MISKPDFALAADCCDIWFSPLGQLKDRENHFFSLLSDAEKARAERFKFDLHRSRFIASHGFVRKVLANYIKIAANRIEFRQARQGKPYLADWSSNYTETLKFNLSHSEDIALLAITRGIEVGVDVEYQKRTTDWRGIVQRFFTESEQRSLFALADTQQQAAFFELWTRKEAYMKVLGTGLSLAPTEFSLTVPPEKPALIKHHSTKFQALEQVSFNTIKLPEAFNQYCASLAVASTPLTCHNYQFS